MVKYLILATGLVALAASIAYHAQAGRYQITAVGGIAGVYRVDTWSGNVSICSPVQEKGCITLAEAYQGIQQRKENMRNTAGAAGSRVEQFTRDRAQELRNMMQKFDEPGEKAAPTPAASGRISL